MVEFGTSLVWRERELSDYALPPLGVQGETKGGSKKDGFINTNTIVKIQGIIEHNNAGIRRLSGTELKNSITEKQFTRHHKMKNR